jgi:hypothetical protein
MIGMWAGVYDWSDDFGEFLETRYTIFAAPHIIRGRQMKNLYSREQGTGNREQS